MIGVLGTIRFEVSDKRIRTFTDFSRTISGRWTAHEVLGKKPKSQYLGPALDQVTFSMSFNARWGVRPDQELYRLYELVRLGKAVPLILGGKIYGSGLWVVKSVEQHLDQVDNKGRVLRASANVSLEEYVK